LPTGIAFGFAGGVVDVVTVGVGASVTGGAVDSVGVGVVVGVTDGATLSVGDGVAVSVGVSLGETLATVVGVGEAVCRGCLRRKVARAALRADADASCVALASAEPRAAIQAAAPARVRAAFWVARERALEDRLTDALVLAEATSVSLSTPSVTVAEARTVEVMRTLTVTLIRLVAVGTAPARRT
jgi:hypothetical protein